MSDELFREAVAEIDAAGKAGVQPEVVLSAHIAASLELHERQTGQRASWRDLLAEGYKARDKREAVRAYIAGLDG